MTPRIAFATILLGLAAVAGCGAPSPAVLPSPTVPASTASSAAPASTGSTASPAPAASLVAGTVTRDDSLLAMLPPDLDGFPVTAEEESFAEAAADPAFAANVVRAAFPIVVAPDNLAAGVIAELAPGVWSDAFFADWRETYDEGACAQAGGVVANAETELDGRTVYITTCDGGLRVYHVSLEERGVLVSLFSLGEDRYGERLVADLRP